MNFMASRPKKSRSSRVQNRKRLSVPCSGAGAKRRAVSCAGKSAVDTHPPAADKPLTPTVRRNLRAEYRAWRAALPTALERDTLLWPEAIAESVVQEASRYLGAHLPEDFPARLAAKAYYLYPRHRHFRKVLNRPGHRGRQSLYVYMRHWLASWLKREQRALFRRLPWEYALGQRLPG
jgi:hypothetical protein